MSEPYEDPDFESSDSFDDEGESVIDFGQKTADDVKKGGWSKCPPGIYHFHVESSETLASEDNKPKRQLIKCAVLAGKPADAKAKEEDYRGIIVSEFLNLSEEKMAWRREQWALALGFVKEFTTKSGDKRICAVGPDGKPISGPIRLKWKDAISKQFVGVIKADKTGAYRNFTEIYAIDDEKTLDVPMDIPSLIESGYSDIVEKRKKHKTKPVKPAKPESESEFDEVV